VGVWGHLVGHGEHPLNIAAVELIHGQNVRTDKIQTDLSSRAAEQW
jgi:hypothetical protein